MTLASVAAVRAAPTVKLEWATTLAATGGTLVYATTASTPAPDAVGMSPTSLNGVDALPGDGLIARVLSDLQGAPAWHALFDLLWVSLDVSVTSTSTTTLTPDPLPARDLDRSSNGRGVILAYAGNGSNVTVTYTNSAGVAGRTAGSAPITSGVAFTLIPLQAGDNGVRSVQTIAVNAASATGAIRVLLLRPIGRYLAGPLNPGERPPMAQSPLIAGTVLLNAHQPSATGGPASYVRADIAMG